MEGVPVYESKGKVKYPVCGRCHTPVIWSYGTCRCGNLVEKHCFEYVLLDAKFVHKKRR
nr:hypothetical protein Cduv_458 [Cedratvirus duvanny]